MTARVRRALLTFCLVLFGLAQFSGPALSAFPQFIEICDGHEIRVVMLEPEQGDEVYEAELPCLICQIICAGAALDVRVATFEPRSIHGVHVDDHRIDVNILSRDQTPRARAPPSFNV